MGEGQRHVQINTDREKKNEVERETETDKQTDRRRQTDRDIIIKDICTASIFHNKWQHRALYNHSTCNMLTHLPSYLHTTTSIDTDESRWAEERQRPEDRQTETVRKRGGGGAEAERNTEIETERCEERERKTDKPWRMKSDPRLEHTKSNISQ